MREENLFLLLAVIIGLFSGLLVVCFRIAIEFTRFAFLGTSLLPPRWRVLLMPVLGGLLVAVLVIRLFPRVRGSGVNQTKAAVYIYDGYVPFNTVLGKFVTCALAIGSGQSLGPEDPSLQIGAGLASALGRRLQLSRDKVRLIAPVGAAAGLAAAFNAPISAVLFVIEEVIGQWSAGVLGAIVLSAVSSVVVVRAFMGDEPLFSIPSYHIVHSIELLAYALLGGIAGFTSVAFTKFIDYARPRLQALPKWTFYVQPAAAGFLIGIIGMWLPQVMGAGYDVIDQALHNGFAWQVLALLAAFKLIATGTSFVSGVPGGMFAPTMFIGAMLGGAVGGAEHRLFPWITGPAGVYSIATFAMVGMGTLFAGFLRVPMTSVFMVLEVSGNYSIILPVMISNTIAYLIARKFQPVALFDLLSRQDGTDLPSMEEQREESPQRVEDAMRRPSLVISGETTLSDAVNLVRNVDEDAFLVKLGYGEWSAVTCESIRRAENEGRGGASVKSIVPRNALPWLHPDQPLHVALRQIADWPCLPVLHRANLERLEGVITLDDVLKSYHAAFRSLGPPTKVSATDMSGPESAPQTSMEESGRGGGL
jgi:CIC family chloride channel protein